MCVHVLYVHPFLTQNAAIARESLELLVTCLKLRSPLLNIFYTLPHVSEFLMDLLLGTPHPDIRISVVTLFCQLCRDVDIGKWEGGA